MCYPGKAPAVRPRGLVIHGGIWWSLLRHETPVTQHEAPAPTGEGSGGDGSIKYCVCSPTRHPGSFRCRHHHAEYVWGGRVINKKLSV